MHQKYVSTWFFLNGRKFHEIFLTCYVCFTREYAPSPYWAPLNLVFSKVTLMSQQVIPVMVCPQSASNALPELGLVDESNFLVSNPQSCVIVQNDLWVEPNPRLNSLFASKAHVHWIMSLKNLTGKSLFIYLHCAPCARPMADDFLSFIANAILSFSF